MTIIVYQFVCAFKALSIIFGLCFDNSIWRPESDVTKHVCLDLYEVYLGSTKSPVHLDVLTLTVLFFD